MGLLSPLGGSVAESKEGLDYLLEAHFSGLDSADHTTAVGSRAALSDEG